MMAFLSKIPVCHVEAGLRSGSLQAPWPEEGNRRVIDSISSLHLAPTPRSFKQLVSEGHENTSFLTGNSIVDSLSMSLERIQLEPHLVSYISAMVDKYPERPIVVVTQHRREKFGVAIRQVFEQVNELAKNGMHVIIPLHLNPEVRKAATEVFSGQEGVSLIEPLNYLNFVKLLSVATIVISDSGGIQEECPSLGVPILITRDSTERPEVIECGMGLLVGENGHGIPNGLVQFLSSRYSKDLPSKTKNPFGELGSSKLIAEACAKFVGV
jgi:UDP-N-acetylglucosamine 2-epimerase